MSSSDNDARARCGGDIARSYCSELFLEPETVVRKELVAYEGQMDYLADVRVEDSSSAELEGLVGGGCQAIAARLPQALSFQPFQKLLFSATMTRNPAQLSKLSLRNPMFFSADVPDRDYSIPQQLQLSSVACELAQKPLVVARLLALEEHAGKQVLIFTQSVDSTHRLAVFLGLFGLTEQKLSVAEYSSSLTQAQRGKVIRRFRKNKIQVVVCSDAMARGMDIEGVDLVINYDVPVYIHTLIHRVGRTARANKPGSAVTVLLPKQGRHFHQMLGKIHGATDRLVKIRGAWDKTDEGVLDKYAEALVKLKEELAAE